MRLTRGNVARMPLSRTRTLATILAAGALLVSVAACAPTQDRGGADPGLRGQWELQSATDGDGSIPLANQLISLTIDGDSNTFGRSTCSDYTAHVYGSEAMLWVTATLPAVENCGIQAQLDIERRYIGDLNRVRSSTVSGGVLHLLAHGIDLQYQRALVVPLNLVIGHTWNLATVAPDSYYATGNPTRVAEIGASIRFSRQGQISGQTVCTTYRADYAENAGEIVIRNLKKTSRLMTTDGNEGCIGESLSADTHLFDVLTSGFTFLSGLGGLTISSPRAELTLGFVDSR
jgi:heat shock protein HslJ